MIVMGIDPGIADTGYGIIKKERDAFVAVDYGTIRTNAGLPLAERLTVLKKRLEKLLKTYQPRRVGIEELFFAKNVKTAIAVSHARGVILLTVALHRCALEEYTPLQVKQAVAGYGRADKPQMQRMVKTILNLSELPHPDDAADALAVAICCAQTKQIT